MHNSYLKHLIQFADFQSVGLINVKNLEAQSSLTSEKEAGCGMRILRHLEGVSFRCLSFIHSQLQTYQIVRIAESLF